MNLTSIVGKLFVPRQKELERHFTDGEQLQKQVLNRLLAQGAHTEYGRKYDFANIHSYEEFTKLVPQTAYEEFESDLIVGILIQDSKPQYPEKYRQDGQYQLHRVAVLRF